MPYSNNLESSNPGCIVFLIDQSGSMGGMWDKTGYSMAYGAAQAVNNAIAEISLRCKKEKEVKPRAMIGVYGYHHNQVDWVITDTPSESGGLASITSIAANVKDEVFVDEEETFVPVFVKEEAGGGTPMGEALKEIVEIVENFAQKYPNSYPPIVINVTDAGSTDMDINDLSAKCSAIKSIATSDGNALVWNIHISNSSAEVHTCPDDGSQMPDELAQAMLDASSPVPDNAKEYARIMYNWELGEEAKCMAYNADAKVISKLLSFASSVSGLDRNDEDM
tara:strand:+ start:101 stop:937 length:837 start_codon:yes stop_codon:yes gene_type:complete